MGLLLIAHVAAAVVVGTSRGRLGRWAFAVGALPMVAMLVYAAANAGGVVDGRPLSQDLEWVDALDLSVALRLDSFSLLMVAVVSGIGVAVMAYATWYFTPDARAARTAGLLVAFAASMLGVVLADNVALLYVAWELTSVTSFLLIGADHHKPEARSAALHALLVTGAGGLAMLGGLVILAREADTWSLSGILDAAPSNTVAGVGLALVAVGIVTKSAQFPTHAWLPSAMVAPTPVSAYLHSATMVKAGIYLAARLAPAFAAVGVWRPAMVTIGLVTLFVGGVRALRQNDLKLLLAMGTISQLGFLLVLFGVGTAEATVAGCVLLVAHALFKATLFLVVGIVDHQCGTRVRGELPGFGRGWLTVKVAAAIAAASMAGLAPVLGFVAKEGAFEAFLHEGAWGIAVVVGLVAGSALTVAYTVRFLVPVLASPRAGEAGAPAPVWPFVAPAAVLSGLTLVVGVGVAPILDPLVNPAATALDPDAASSHLALWHGFGVPLALSAVVFALGAVLVAARRPVGAVLGALAPRWGGADAYAASVRGLNEVARLTARVAQSGSLPIYVAVITLTAAIVPGSVLVARSDWPGWPSIASSPLQAVVAGVIVVAAVATAMMTRRFAAVLALGTVGYSVALVFVIQGAPDLALTQFAIETLTVVVFVLVLRFLPPQFHRRRPALGAPVRIAVSTVVAASVFVFVLVANGSRTVPPISGELIERSYDEAGGRNVVNVILVDFRGLDTLGEISVLFVTALGAITLARIGRFGLRDRSGGSR